MLTEADHELRRHGIGGSEIAAILGLSSFASPLDVYLAKVEGYRQEESSDMQRGTYLEGGMLDWYARRFGVTVERPRTIAALELGPVVASPDGLAALEAGARRLLEVKCPRRSVGWENGPPEAYVLQAQWTWMALEDTSAVEPDTEIHIVALLDSDLRVFPVRADVEMQRDLLAFASSWWSRHVVAKVPPPLDGGDGAHEWLKRRFPANPNPIRPATSEEDLLMLELRTAEEEAARALAVSALLEQRLKERIGDASGIESPAGRITWKADKHGKRSFRTNWKGTT